MTPAEFARKVRRSQRLAVREMRDGCNDCRACRGLCPAHAEAALEVVLRPRNSPAVKEILLGEPAATAD